MYKVVKPLKKKIAKITKIQRMLRKQCENARMKDILR